MVYWLLWSYPVGEDHMTICVKSVRVRHSVIRAFVRALLVVLSSFIGSMLALQDKVTWYCSSSYSNCMVVTISDQRTLTQEIQFTQMFIDNKGYDPGADPGFQVRGAHLKKIAPSRGRRENFWGISCEKSRFYAKKSYFSNIRGGDGCAPPPGSAPVIGNMYCWILFYPISPIWSGHRDAING